MSYWTREGCVQQLTSACCHTAGEAIFHGGRHLNVTPAGCAYNAARCSSWCTLQLQQDAACAAYTNYW